MTIRLNNIEARLEKLEGRGARPEMRGLLAENILLHDFLRQAELVATTSGFGMGHLKQCVKGVKRELAELE